MGGAECIVVVSGGVLVFSNGDRVNEGALEWVVEGWAEDRDSKGGDAF